jgi:transposase
MGTDARKTEILATDNAATKRRFRSKQERRQIANESLQPGASVAVVARRHGVNANQVFHWRKLLREGLLDLSPPSTQLMPVRVTEVAQAEQAPARPCSGAIHIEVGRARVRVEGSVDCDSLRLILELLSR